MSDRGRKVPVRVGDRVVLTLPENATTGVRWQMPESDALEIVADDVVVTGRVVGRVRGLKVRLNSSARVEGDIVHKTIAIESGAHFEGSVQRQEDPLGDGGKAKSPSSAASSSGSSKSDSSD